MKPPVLLAYLLIGLGAFYFGSSRKDEEISIKNERINFLDDQIAAYKDRLQGATPDEAAKRIAALQTELEAYIKKFDAMFPEGPRKLNQDQLKILASHKDRMVKFGTPLEVYSGILGDSTVYAQDFIDFFKSQHIPVTGPANFPCYTGQRGVIVGIKDPVKPSDNATTFLQILNDANIHAGPTYWGQPPSTDSLDFDLYICPSF